MNWFCFAFIETGQFLEEACDLITSIPCYVKCDQSWPKVTMHYHCPECAKVCVEPESFVKHCADHHEYSLVYAVHLDHLLNISQNLHTEDELIAATATTAKDKESAATIHNSPSSSSSDEAEITEGSRGESDDLPEVEITKLVEDTACGRYHCKLCPPSSTIATLEDAKIHLRYLHVASQLVIARRWVCLPCFMDCGPPVSIYAPKSVHWCKLDKNAVISANVNLTRTGYDHNSPSF
jgi:hypothetical protein